VPELKFIASERCKALAGAVIRVTFTLTNWFIDSDANEQASATNSFVAVELITWSPG
jgi:hypothetical protein